MMTGLPDNALRDAVLAGVFFGAAHREAGSALAEFLVAPAPAALTAWFGANAARLGDDRIALRCALDRDIAALDDLIGALLDAILHHPRLQRLEGSWRGLRWLANQTDPGGRVKLRLFSAIWPELCRDLERAPEFDQSQMFRRIYEDEFGIAGGEPFGLLVMDYEIRHRPASGSPTDDIAALASFAGVAAGAFSPMVFSPSPALFGVDSIAGLSGLADPAGEFGAADYQRWRGLAGREDIRFIALATPRLAARPLWDEAVAAHRGFRYVESCETTQDRVWFGAGYAVAAAVGRAFQNFSWPADIRGFETDRVGGGLIELGDEPWFATELALTDNQERSLVDAGMMPLATLQWGGEAVLTAARSLQAPKRFTTRGGASANANARVSAQFSTMICVSRFAHFVKIMGRDMVGSFRTADDIEAKLSGWLKSYANSNQGAGAESRARYPLLSASVEVGEQAGKPGSYRCVIHMQPHFQLDDVAASFRLVTELAAPGRG